MELHGEVTLKFMYIIRTEAVDEPHTQRSCFALTDNLSKTVSLTAPHKPSEPTRGSLPPRYSYQVTISMYSCQASDVDMIRFNVDTLQRH